jgi:hypothetical protein
MRRLGLLVIALAVVSAVATAPARALACGGRPALTPGCCCKDKAPAPPKAPCCQVAPASSDAAVLSGLTALPALGVAAVPVLPEPPRVADEIPQIATLQASPPGSPPVFLLDCTFRI